MWMCSRLQVTNSQGTCYRKKYRLVHHTGSYICPLLISAIISSNNEPLRLRLSSYSFLMFGAWNTVGTQYTFIKQRGMCLLFMTFFSRGAQRDIKWQQNLIHQVKQNKTNWFTGWWILSKYKWRTESNLTGGVLTQGHLAKILPALSQQLHCPESAGISSWRNTDIWLKSDCAKMTGPEKTEIRLPTHVPG